MYDLIIIIIIIFQGVVNHLTTRTPVEFVISVTQHQMKGKSALYNYIEADHAALQPGASILAGWPAFPWGQCGRGAAAPSLDALGEDAGRLHEFVDMFFHLQCREKILRRRGGLYEMTRASCASLIMHYAEMHRAGEFPFVVARMLETYVILYYD